MASREYWENKLKEACGGYYKVHPDERIIYDEEKGLAGFRFDLPNATLIATKMIGDGKHWRRRFWQLAKSLEYYGLKYLELYTLHDPKTYIRLLSGRDPQGLECIGTWTGDGVTFNRIRIDLAKSNWPYTGKGAF